MITINSRRTPKLAGCWICGQRINEDKCLEIRNTLINASIPLTVWGHMSCGGELHIALNKLKCSMPEPNNAHNRY